jgi:hypothetical protein
MKWLLKEEGRRRERIELHNWCAVAGGLMRARCNLSVNQQQPHKQTQTQIKRNKTKQTRGKYKTISSFLFFTPQQQQQQPYNRSDNNKKPTERIYFFKKKGAKV